MFDFLVDSSATQMSVNPVAPGVASNPPQNPTKPHPSPDYQPPFPPFFFFCGAFLRVAPEAAGFCCRGGTTLLPAAADEPAADPGLGEVGGLLAVLLASLEGRKNQNPVRDCHQECHTGPNRGR